jgi:hypothetical protein
MRSALARFNGSATSGASFGYHRNLGDAREQGDLSTAFASTATLASATCGWRNLRPAAILIDGPEVPADPHGECVNPCPERLAGTPPPTEI